MKIFRMCASILPGHYSLEYHKRKNGEYNGKYDWLRMGDMIDGKIPYSPDFFDSINLYVPLKRNRPLDDALDFHGGSHPGFLISDKCYRVIMFHLHRSLSFYPMKVNGSPWHYMVNRNEIDCLDPTRAETRPGPPWVIGNRPRSAYILTYAFMTERLREFEIFTIIEDSAMQFCTEGVVNAFLDAGINGFHFIDTQDKYQWKDFYMGQR